MNDNHRCLIKILAPYQEGLTTGEILEKTRHYPELCRGCSSGTQIISAGMELVAEQRVIREIAKGGFRWKLIQ